MRFSIRGWSLMLLLMCFASSGCGNYGEALWLSESRNRQLLYIGDGEGYLSTVALGADARMVVLDRRQVGLGLPNGEVYGLNKIEKDQAGRWIYWSTGPQFQEVVYRVGLDLRGIPTGEPEKLLEQVGSFTLSTDGSILVAVQMPELPDVYWYIELQARMVSYAIPKAGEGLTAISEIELPFCYGILCHRIYGLFTSTALPDGDVVWIGSYYQSGSTSGYSNLSSERLLSTGELTGERTRFFAGEQVSAFRLNEGSLFVRATSSGYGQVALVSGTGRPETCIHYPSLQRSNSHPACNASSAAFDTYTKRLYTIAAYPPSDELWTFSLAEDGKIETSTARVQRWREHTSLLAFFHDGSVVLGSYYDPGQWHPVLGAFRVDQTTGIVEREPISTLTFANVFVLGRD